eukprot:4316048-Amphidinium_carterae.1
MARWRWETVLRNFNEALLTAVRQVTEKMQEVRDSVTESAGGRKYILNTSSAISSMPRSRLT